MRARATRTLTLAAAGAVAATALLGLTACGTQADTTAAAQVAPAQPAATTEAAPAGGPRTAEDAFITATAAHLCTVQSTVYDNPAEMAKAYAATPAYPGLTKAQVTQLRERLTADATFADRLTTNLQTTCKP
ncbi:hypothetical protein ACFQFC_38905 [Amorphoplanes digitatis]|uniref:Haemophore haem-binding domain-containing protein n=1 Tax=Actinoplanes digitatis TaxID=1868 RepID=A0A7W7MQ79_9ACTN|nr:hypothetical protein [Actinoplanes digitatis]MBB4762139.1 hypothetical protein [Actinoplanes digitatis]GID96236.1 hypothetical protein Adi01nite_56480 [Actinoplanes digitatis]